MPSYIAPVVQEIIQFYGPLLYEIQKFPNIPAHLAALADKMWTGVQSNQTVVYAEINNYHPDYLGKSIPYLKNVDINKAICKKTIACEHGFKDWASVERLGDLQYDFRFEQAVNLLLAGEFTALQQHIHAHPKLVVQRSSYPHGATLLHYAGSNGVEFWRQQVPYNLPEITAFLLEQGADKTATMRVYGGEHTSLALLLSSAHPYKADIVTEMKNLLS